MATAEVYLTIIVRTKVLIWPQHWLQLGKCQWGLSTHSAGQGECPQALLADSITINRIRLIQNTSTLIKV